MARSCSCGVNLFLVTAILFFFLAAVAAPERAFANGPGPDDDPCLTWCPNSPQTCYTSLPTCAGACAYAPQPQCYQDCYCTDMCPTQHLPCCHCCSNTCP